MVQLFGPERSKEAKVFAIGRAREKVDRHRNLGLRCLDALYALLNKHAKNMKKR